MIWFNWLTESSGCSEKGVHTHAVYGSICSEQAFPIWPLDLPANRVVILAVLHHVSEENCPPGLLPPGMLREVSAADDTFLRSRSFLSTPTWRGRLLYTCGLISEEQGCDTVNGTERRERESLVYLPFCWENKEAKKCYCTLAFAP